MRPRGWWCLRCGRCSLPDRAGDPGGNCKRGSAARTCSTDTPVCVWHSCLCLAVAQECRHRQECLCYTVRHAEVRHRQECLCHTVRHAEVQTQTGVSVPHTRLP